MIESVRDYLNSGSFIGTILLIGWYVLLAWVVVKVSKRFIQIFIERSVEKMASDRAGAGLDPATKEERIRRLKTVMSVIAAAIRVVVWAVAIAVIIVKLDIPTGPFSVVVGAAGVALGFGAQSLIKDFLNGAFILSENQYKIGDVVRIGNFEGEVKHITMRLTILRDKCANVHYIPNGSITSVTNLTDRYSRMEVKFKVPTETDLVKLDKSLQKIQSNILSLKPLRAKLKKDSLTSRINDISSGIEVVIAADTRAGEQWSSAEDTRRIALEELRSSGIKLS